MPACLLTYLPGSHPLPAATGYYRLLHGDTRTCLPACYNTTLRAVLSTYYTCLLPHTAHLPAFHHLCLPPPPPPPLPAATLHLPPATMPGSVGFPSPTVLYHTCTCLCLPACLPAITAATLYATLPAACASSLYLLHYLLPFFLCLAYILHTFHLPLPLPACTHAGFCCLPALPATPHTHHHHLPPACLPILPVPHMLYGFLHTYHHLPFYTAHTAIYLVYLVPSTYHRFACMGSNLPAIAHTCLALLHHTVPLPFAYCCLPPPHPCLHMPL